MSAEPPGNPNAAVRNLLFAAVALRHDFIDEGQFLRACAIWAARPEGALADVLIEHHWLKAEDRGLVERLMERKLQQHQGDAGAGLGASLGEDLVRALAVLNEPALRQVLDAAAPVLSLDLRPDHPRERYHKVKDNPEMGGIGQVWRVFDRHLEREVALKELQPQKALDGPARQRFVREAKITAQLTHPNIVPVFELIQPEADALSFYTMKFIEGQTLTEEIDEYHRRRADGKADPVHFNRLLDAFVAVAHAVAHAHKHRILHRDLKSSNVILGGSGEVFVVDWGLAKVMGRDAAEGDSTVHWEAAKGPSDATIRGAVMGTPAYMPPEQACGLVDALDERSDVFGLGAILCQILSGQPPYQGKTTDELIDQAREGKLDETYRRLDACGADAPLVELAKRCLARAMEDRPRSAGEVVAAVSAHRAAAQERLRQVELERTAAQAKAQEERRRRRAERVLAAVGIVFTVALSVIGVRYYRSTYDFEQTLKRHVQDATGHLGQVEPLLVGLHDQLDKDTRSYKLLGDLNSWQNDLDRAAALIAQLDKIPPEYFAALPDELRDRCQAVKDDWREQTRLLQVALELDEIRLLDFSLCEARPAPAVSGPRLAAALGARFRLSTPVTELTAAERVRLAQDIAKDTLRHAWVAALDHWAAFTADAALAPRLLEIAGQADPDRGRDRLRDAKKLGDRHYLKGLAARTDLEQNSSQLLIALAYRLTQADEREEALVLLERAHKTHLPEDVGLVLFWARLADDKDRSRILGPAPYLRKKNAVVQNSLGFALLDQGEDREALKHFEAAVSFDARYPDAYWNAGLTRLRLAEFKAAQDALLKGAELAAGLADWDGKLAAVRLQKCEELLALDEQLPSLLKDFDLGKAIPLAQRLAAADLCARYKKMHARAAALYESAFGAAPADALLDKGLYFVAACAAIQAATEDSKGAAALRQKALSWLNVELDRVKKKLHALKKHEDAQPVVSAGTAVGLMSGPPGQGLFPACLALTAPGRTANPEKDALIKRLQQWRQDKCLAGVLRLGPGDNSPLPPQEQKGWQKFRSELDSLLMGTVP